MRGPKGSRGVIGIKGYKGATGLLEKIYVHVRSDWCDQENIITALHVNEVIDEASENKPIATKSFMLIIVVFAIVYGKTMIFWKFPHIAALINHLSIKFSRR